MGKKTFFVAFLVVVFGVQGLAADEGFAWQLALVSGGQGLPIDSPVNMNNGGRLSIDLYSERACYVYIVREQASGAIVPVNSQFRARRHTQRFPITLDQQSGEETFFVVASIIEQTDLQRALENYGRDGSAMNARIVKDILFEIRDPLGENPGSPVDFAGATRGPEGRPIGATAYSGSSVYTKTITISH